MAAGPPVGRILSNEWACVQGVDWTASQTTLGLYGLKRTRAETPEAERGHFG